MTLKQTTFLKTCFRLPGLDPTFLYKDAPQDDTIIFLLLNQLALLDLPGIKLHAKSYLVMGDYGYAVELLVNGKEHQLILVIKKDQLMTDVIKNALELVNTFIQKERQPMHISAKKRFLMWLGMENGLLTYHLIRNGGELYLGCLPEKLSIDIKIDAVRDGQLPELKPFPLAALSYQAPTETPLSLLTEEYENADAERLSKFTGHNITNNDDEWQVTLKDSGKKSVLECGDSYHSVTQKLNELTRNSDEHLHIISYPWSKELLLYLRNGDEKTYRKIVNPDDFDGVFEVSRDQKRLELIEAYLAKNENDISAIATLTTCYGNIGNHQKALDLIDRYLPLAPDNFIMLNNTLIAYTKLRKYKEGVEAGERVLQMSHKRSNTYYFMGVCYTELGMFDEAVSHMQKALVDNPNRPYNFFQLAYTYYRMKNLDKAIENYHMAVNKASAHDLTRSPIPSAFYNLACLYSVQNKIEESATAFRKAIELDPKYKKDLHEDDELENLRKAMTEEELFNPE